jgi:asparagine synthase (glutamine-hydrolysing)
MVSDMPLGTFLSGGLDSSIITAVCAKEFSTRGMRLPTFSVDYFGNELYFVANKFQPDSDGAYIRRMQRETDSIHSYTVLTPEALYEALREATAARDLPGMADVDSSLLLFCQDIRSRVKVALSGECADEIFGGYPWYRDPEVTVEAGFPWAQNTAQRARLMCPLLRNNLDPYDYVMDACMDTCRDSDILPGNSPRDIQIKQMVNLNFQWFMQTLLDRKDRMSMYCSLEVRVPFCDYRIAEYLYGVPWAFKDSQGREKGLLREAVRGLLPDEVLLRKKSPYPKTFHPEYTTLVGTELARILDNPAAPLHGLIDKMAVREMLEGESPWPWYGQLMRRPQTMAYLLQVNHWLEHYKVNICL